MISKIESRTIAEIEVIDVTLEGHVGNYEGQALADAAMARPECKHLMVEFCTDSCRGISADRLSYVLRFGIDVDPTNAPIWVSSIDKAMEYGDWPKLVLVLNAGSLDRTFRGMPISTDAAERASVRKNFPTECVSQDGSSIWLSRLPHSDTRLATPYEMAYARWIPGDARAALRAVVVIQHPMFGPPVNLNDFNVAQH